MRIRNHILFWIAYVLFKTYLNLSWESDSFWSTIPVLLLLQLTLLPIKIPLVYTCFYVIDNYLLGKWREWQSASALVLAFAIGIVGMTLVNHLVILPYILKVDSSAVPIFHIDSLFYHLFTLCFVGGAAVSIRLLRRQYQSRLREVELQKEKTETELKYLKSQINPHFLFNTLNNIYSLARKGSEQTPESVLKLSKLMRFMLYDASNPVVLLTDELRLIQDYISLEKLRYSERLTVTYNESIDDPSQTIAPLLLIHFVENAFKHGVSESRFDSSVIIVVTLKEGVLYALIKNSKPHNVEKENNQPIGMENVKRQLELVYPRHQLTIENHPDQFIVNLLIPLN